MSDQQQTQSQNEAESIEVDVEALLQSAKAEIKGHTWRQRGPWLVCISCKTKHASWLGINKQLVGINEKGEPIVRALAR
jgi:hypothetical protein